MLLFCQVGNGYYLKDDSADEGIDVTLDVAVLAGGNKYYLKDDSAEDGMEVTLFVVIGLAVRECNRMTVQRV